MSTSLNTFGSRMVDYSGSALARSVRSRMRFEPKKPLSEKERSGVWEVVAPRVLRAPSPGRHRLQKGHDMKTTLFTRHHWLPTLLCFIGASANGQLLRPAAGAVTGMIQEDAEVETSGPV